MPPRTKPRAILALELAKVASLAIAPAAAVLYGFAWFVRTVQDPLWVLIALFVMTLSVGIAIFLISIWCDRRMSDDIAAQSGVLGLRDTGSPFAR